MTERKAILVIGMIIGLIAGLAVSPAFADKVGGYPDTCAAGTVTGTSPALFDTDGIAGPSPGDEVAYFDAIPLPPKGAGAGIRAFASARVAHPNDVCFEPTYIAFAESPPSARGLWPGLYDQVMIPSVNASFAFDQQDGDLNATGGTFTQTGFFGQRDYVLDLQASTRAEYNRVNVSSPWLTTSGGILGWDTTVPADGVPEYIGLSWAGMGGFEPCEGRGGDLNDSVMMWLPVNPHPTVPGAVMIVADFDCDGVDDGVFPPCPALIPETMVPVELTSFTVASVRSISPGGLASAAFAMIVLIPGIRFVRRWLPGLDI